MGVFVSSTGDLAQDVMQSSVEFTLATVIHSYQPTSEEEIKLSKGETLTVYEKHDNGWWVGETLTGIIGIFPGSYVQETKQTKEKEEAASGSTKNAQSNSPTEQETNSPERKSIGKALVLYDYKGQTNTELSLTQGTTVNILRKLQPN